MVNRITKMYSNGRVTLEAGFFPPIHQSVIDSEIRNSVPFTVAVERLKEYEDRDCNGCEMCNGVSAINISSAIKLKQGAASYIDGHIKSNYCPKCGRKLRDSK